MDAGLYPAPGPKRGEAMKWVVWSNVSLGEAVSRLMYAHGDKAGAFTLNCLANQGCVRLCSRARVDDVSSKH